MTSARRALISSDPETVRSDPESNRLGRQA